jgi:outer membrane protein assembly factor BamB/Icc-related predicted phosphoesterase
MKRYLILLTLLLTSFSLFSQSYKYAWISDIHIGAPDADKNLDSVVADINRYTELDFLIATGDIAEKGKDQELETAKDILDKLKIPYFIIPGNHDSKWSESGFTRFSELWGDDKFLHEHNGTYHIGINSGIPWRGGGGHYSPEDLNWLEDVLSDIPDNAELFFYSHHPPNGDVDNWFKAYNLLIKKNIKAIFVGHGHANKILNFNGIPGAMGRSTLARPKFPGFTLVESAPDSIFFSEVLPNVEPKQWGVIPKELQTELQKIDSVQFAPLSDNVNILFKKELNSSLSATLLVSDDRFFSASIDGKIICYNLNGTVRWEYETGGTIFSRPVRDRDVLAVGTIQGDLFTFNANTGDIIQIIGIGESVTSQLIAIDIVDEDRKTKGVVVGTSSGKLFCYNLYSLKQMWQNQFAAEMIETRPLYVNNKLIYGSWDNYLYCVDALTGGLIWRWTENKNFYYSPAAAVPVTDGQRVYIATPDKFISAIDMLQGKTVWRKELGNWESLSLSADNSLLLVKNLTDKFSYISVKDGKLVRDINLGFGLDTMPIEPLEINGNIFFGGKNGKVYRIKPDHSFEELFFMGTARIHSVQRLNDQLIASNMDGTIVIFEVTDL